MAHHDETIEPLLEANEGTVVQVDNFTDPPAATATREEPESETDRNNECATAAATVENQPGSASRLELFLFSLAALVLVGISAFFLAGGVLCTRLVSKYDTAGGFYNILSVLLIVKFILCLKPFYLHRVLRCDEDHCDRLETTRRCMWYLDYMLVTAIFAVMFGGFAWLIEHKETYPFEPADNHNSTIENFFGNGTYLYEDASDSRIKKCGDFLYLTSAYKNFIGLGIIIAVFIMALVAVLTYMWKAVPCCRR